MYRAAWVVALVLAVAALFTLGRPDTPKLSQEPATFDGRRAAEDLRTLAQDYPQRVAGSDADNRSALWVLQELKQAGLETHIDGVASTVAGKDVALQNVWGVSRGDSAGTILVIANRDVPPTATQGANDNASGVAALLELARTFTVTAHRHTMLFLCTSGDAFGGLGARRFAETHEVDDLYAVIALRRVATKGDKGIGLDGWSAAAKTAPPWLWLLAAPASRVTANAEARLPGVATQILRLAVPTSPGSQAPFVATGVPGISLSWAGERVPSESDTVDTVSTENLTRVGTTATAMLLSIDTTTAPGERSGGAVFLTRGRTLPGGTLAFLLGVLLLPPAAVTVDLFAQGRRARIPRRGAWERAALRTAPWLAIIALVYLANLVGLLPRSPDAVIPPDSGIVASPRYLRVAVLALVLVLAYLYTAAVERRLERRAPSDPRATVFVAHAVLVFIALLVMLINPYSVLLVLPAGILWPLARPGSWTRSILPVYAGLGMIVVALVYYAFQLGLGWKVWWYFFLLLENRTIPAGVVLLGAAFVSTAGLLARALHTATANGAANVDDAARAGAQPDAHASGPGATPEDAGIQAILSKRVRNTSRRGFGKRRAGRPLPPR